MNRRKIVRMNENALGSQKYVQSTLFIKNCIHVYIKGLI